MSANTRQEEIVVSKCRKAFHLAKEGKYEQARFILHDVEDHPRARKLVERLDTMLRETQSQRPKRRSKSPISCFGMILIATVILMVGGSIVGARLFDSVFGSMGLPELVGMGDTTSFYEIDTEYTPRELLQHNLEWFCIDYVSLEESGRCDTWADDLAHNHYDDASRCMDAYDSVLFMSHNEATNLNNCLSRKGIAVPAS